MQVIKYIKADRSNFKPNFVKKDSNDQIDIGYTEGVFTDGRPYRTEFWAANQISYLTYYFSSADIESMTANDLKEYLISEHVIKFHDTEFQSSGYTGINIDAKKKLDASGNELWEVTVIVGDEDGTYILDYNTLRKYPK